MSLSLSCSKPVDRVEMSSRKFVWCLRLCCVRLCVCVRVCAYFCVRVCCARVFVSVHVCGCACVCGQIYLLCINGDAQTANHILALESIATVPASEHVPPQEGSQSTPCATIEGSSGLLALPQGSQSFCKAHKEESALACT